MFDQEMEKKTIQFHMNIDELKEIYENEKQAEVHKIEQYKKLVLASQEEGESWKQKWELQEEELRGQSERESLVER